MWRMLGASYQLAKQWTSPLMTKNPDGCARDFGGSFPAGKRTSVCCWASARGPAQAPADQGTPPFTIPNRQ